MRGAKKREWKEVPGLPGYFVDSVGVLRDSDWNFLKPVLDSRKGDAFYTVRGKKLWVKELVRELFGKELKVDNYWRMAIATRTPAHAERRRCHDCGKPTSNYRCKECWEKIRGKVDAEYEEPSDAYQVRLRRLREFYPLL